MARLDLGGATKKWGNGHKTIDIHPQPENRPNVEELSVTVGWVSAVHLLLAAGHGRVEHEGVPFLHKTVGHIELQFSAGDSHKQEPVLGKHLRAWASGNMGNLVREVDHSITKPASVSHDQNYRIDMISIPVADAPRDLTAIRAVARFEITPAKPISLPSIIISAITCERTI